jgi:hypothetical protein
VTLNPSFLQTCGGKPRRPVNSNVMRIKSTEKCE